MQSMTNAKLTFSDLFEELKLEIFKYLDLNERIRYCCVSREWFAILSRLLTLQQTLAIGQPEYDSTSHMKLSLCNINSLHVATCFNTIGTKDLVNKYTEDEAAVVISRLLNKFNKLKSIFIYARIKMKLSDLSETIEHIHFGHNAENLIAFDKTNFEKLTCVSTIDAHLEQSYSNGLIELLKAQKSRIQNVSVCEVPSSLCQQIIEMKNLKQLFVFDFMSNFDALYKENYLEIMDAHPQLQYFNMFSYFPTENQICPTDGIRWLMEFGSKSMPLNRKFIIDVFKEGTLKQTLEFGKTYIHGLYLTFDDDFDLTKYKTKLSALVNLRISYSQWSDSDFLDIIFNEDVPRSLQHIFDIAPNVKNIHLRFLTYDVFVRADWIEKILNEVSAYAVVNLKKSISFKLSAMGPVPDVTQMVSNLPKNLRVSLSSCKGFDDIL